MSSQNTHERTPFAALQNNYRQAWHHFTIEVESLQSALQSTPANEDLIQEARKRVDASAAAYREARNTLAGQLLHSDSHPREMDRDIDVVLEDRLTTEELWSRFQPA